MCEMWEELKKYVMDRMEIEHDDIPSNCFGRVLWEMGRLEKKYQYNNVEDFGNEMEGGRLTSPSDGTTYRLRDALKYIKDVEP